jgi:hypothetical protein
MMRTWREHDADMARGMKAHGSGVALETRARRRRPFDDLDCPVTGLCRSLRGFRPLIAAVTVDALNECAAIRSTVAERGGPCCQYSGSRRRGAGAGLPHRALPLPPRESNASQSGAVRLGPCVPSFRGGCIYIFTHGLAVRLHS